MSPVAREAVALTLEEWASLSEEEPGEFVTGFLEEEEVPGLAHESVVAWLIGALRAWRAGRGGFVFGSEAKFAVAPYRGRKADASVYFPDMFARSRRRWARWRCRAAAGWFWTSMNCGARSIVWTSRSTAAIRVGVPRDRARGARVRRPPGRWERARGPCRRSWQSRLQFRATRPRSC